MLIRTSLYLKVVLSGMFKTEAQIVLDKPPNPPTMDPNQGPETLPYNGVTGKPSQNEGRS